MTDVAAVLAERRELGLLRELRVLDSAIGPRVELDGASVVLLCSNDYLGLAADARVTAAAAAAAERWGAGAGASPLVAGHLRLHAELEAELARFKDAEACVLFGSGYLANTGVIAALAGPGDVVCSDALNHASIVDGCRLARAETVVYPHGDVEALDAALARAPHGRGVVVTDAVFSMDGDLAPLSEIVAVARRRGARVVVDEAHATGIVGPGGRGLVAALGLEREVDVVIGTLGKALGSYGAFACAGAELVAFLVNRARTLIYSTALPPPSVGAALAALDLVRAQPELVARARANARLLRDTLRERGFDVAPGEMPIVPLLVGDPAAAMALSAEALRRGAFAQAIRPPTVPEGSSRLRVVSMATHRPDELRLAAGAFAAAAVDSARAHRVRDRPWLSRSPSSS
ncbi:MAG TPA: 8-amino-7-oxononanoate synthase [Solirubrobacteraceae bacterium]|nr:8-amino-7-oxononanoate synthase [Solirubrobacteraceae bacterium]